MVLVSGWNLIMRYLKWISAKSVINAHHKWEIWLRSSQGDLKNQDQSTLWILFLTCDIFVELKLFIYIWNAIECLFIVKNSGNLITSSKMFHVTLPIMKCIMLQWGNDITINNHCNVTMGRWCCHGNQAITWPTVGSFTQNTEKPGYFHSRLSGGKTWICHLKIRI